MRCHRFTLPLLLGLAVIALFGLGSSSSPRLEVAADMSQFQAGNIITDEVFFDSGTMSAAAIADFLNRQGAACVVGSDGSPCLKNWVGATSGRSADSYCPGGYAGVPGGESAASVIFKAAQGCGINPQVLVVMLQKEQGLVRTTNPSANAYLKAMGYGCPDSSVCQSQYYGLQNQIYLAARQFQRYRAGVIGGYHPGMTNYIGYYPGGNARCGVAAVYIQNQATAGLYDYTPYVPNQAALDAGYGTGDSCSSYGNRNFFGYFTDWFGSTQSTGASAIYLKYQALGGSSSVLGDPVALTQCGLPAGGCGRAYQYGSIYWTRATGAAALTGDILNAYWASGNVSGPWGYPTYDSGPVTGGTAAAFQRGSVYSSAATGTHMVGSELLQDWWGTGGITGPLGWPIVDSQNLPGGTGGAFQGGSVYWSAATGAHWLNGDIRAKYWATGNVSGILGYPTTDQVDVTGGTAIAFTGGSIYSSPGTGANVVRGASRSAWWARGGITGPLGYPTADTADVTGVDGTKGQVGVFSGGTLYTSSATPASLMSGAVLAAYQAAGGPAQLGFPIVDQQALTGGEGTALQKASIYWSSGTGAHVVSGASRSAWWGRGGITGPLGYPTADTADVTGLGGTKGQVGVFSGGTLYTSSATQPATMSGAILAAYQAAGGPAQLGFPVADQVTEAVALQKASIYWSAGTGAHVVRGPALSAYWAAGSYTGPLGYPTADTTDVTGNGLSGTVTAFSGGRIYETSTTGARVVRSSVDSIYRGAGGPASSYGWPVTSSVAVGPQWSNDFQNGSITG